MKRGCQDQPERTRGAPDDRGNDRQLCCFHPGFAVGAAGVFAAGRSAGVRSSIRTPSRATILIRARPVGPSPRDSSPRLGAGSRVPPRARSVRRSGLRRRRGRRQRGRGRQAGDRRLVRRRPPPRAVLRADRSDHGAYDGTRRRRPMRWRGSTGPTSTATPSATPVARRTSASGPRGSATARLWPCGSPSWRLSPPEHGSRVRRRQRICHCGSPSWRLSPSIPTAAFARSSPTGNRPPRPTRRCGATAPRSGRPAVLDEVVPRKRSFRLVPLIRIGTSRSGSARTGRCRRSPAGW